MKATMATDDSESESAGGALVRELSQNMLDQDEASHDAPAETVHHTSAQGTGETVEHLDVPDR